VSVSSTSSQAASLLRVRADDPEYLRLAAAEAAYWQNAHPFGLEETQKQFRDGFFEHSVNLRFTGEARTHWSETISRWGNFRRGLVLGTSSLRWETRLLETNPGLHLLFTDLSPGAVERRAKLVGERFPGRVSTATMDLNFADLPADTYDLVVSSSTIHHVTNLEYLAFQVNRTLTPNGRFFLEDYVGEARFQFTEDKKRLFEVIYRRDLARQPGRQFGIRWLDESDLSPFCGVRSHEILAAFRTQLDEVQVRTAATLSGLIIRMRPTDEMPVPPYWKIRLARIRKRFGLQRADVLGRKFLEELFLVGDLASEAGLVLPNLAFAVYGKRR
jgi:SAM-dependent methyltransferase